MSGSPAPVWAAHQDAGRRPERTIGTPAGAGALIGTPAGAGARRR